MDKLVDRPKRRRLFKPRQPAWIVLEPGRIGMAGGAVSATLALVYYFVRGIMGHPVTPDRALIGAAATFVVGYGATGVFTWYLLWVADREMPVPEDELRFGRHRIKGGNNAPAEPEPGESAAAATEEPE